ncbi:MAG TPA: protein-disulfide reductase DsbD domain-containing protein [Bryobacteraceae bacterium]|nr:protein-disulfide reductase DsbD domain-containing protein [Bryobacteraceae bacterium]
MASLPTPAASQTSLNSLSSVVSVGAPEKIVARRNSTQTLDLTISIRSGYHVNSHTPADEYLIPLKISFAPSNLQVSDVTYPTPKMQKFQFSAKPVSVFEGDVKASAKVRVPATVPAGTTHLNGKLRYQACNDRMCLPPRTLDVKVPVEIRN